MPRPAAHTSCVVLHEHLSNHYVGPLARGAVAAAAELGVRLILYSPLSIYLDRRSLTPADIPLLPQGVDSFLLPEHVSDEVVAACRRTGARLLFYAGLRADAPTIGPDNRGGARAATEHLLGHGRRRVVHLAGLASSHEAHERLAGYREALAAAGVPFRPELVREGCFRVQEAEEALAAIIGEGLAFDAVFAANDLEARGALAALARAGLRVPEDVAVVGFDDAPGSDRLDPPLTTVRQSAFQIGWDSIALLAAGDPPPHTSARAQLVVRRSCGCPGGGAPPLEDRLGAGQGPLVDAARAQAWTAGLLAALEGGRPEGAARAAEAAADLVDRQGGEPAALRHAVDAWLAGRAGPGARLAAEAAKARLADLLDDRHARERLERGRRINAITYVLDLLREYSYDQPTEPVLRYMVDSGPAAALSVARGASPDTVAAQRVGPGGAGQWQGRLAEFPPAGWLAPGEAMLLMPVQAGAQQRVLVGVVEREGRAHLDLDDQLLRSVNTYRSITALNETLRELDAARSVQLSLLPRRAPDTERYDIAGATRTARQVGGDLYGYYARAGGELALALGDVAGKGMPAALLMSACATALAGTVQSGLPPGPTLAQVHRMLLPSVGRGQNAAVCLAYLDGPRVRIANAGAVAPVVVSAAGARFVDVGGLPLGTPLSGLAPYAEVELTLEPGDMVILSSDGIVEAMSEAGEMFGFERFLAAVQRGPADSAQGALAHLFDEVAAFGGESELHDDMAIVVARYRG